jgi:protein-L-isoaspartate(D-aspartate) O-methyltransferase
VPIEHMRRSYAEHVCSVAGVQDEALIDAFATVPRERFLAPGPWKIVEPPLPGASPTSLTTAPLGYQDTPDARPEHLYRDVLVAIDPARQLNNGQPSAHARWIGAVAPRSGESVLHVGCGTGYFTAILAELVGAAGRVVALEVDDDLAKRARLCLEPWSHVVVKPGAWDIPAASFNVVYVNAGATHGRADWLAALMPGGRILLPLTVHLPMFPQGHGVGIALRAERSGGTRWPVRIVSPVGIFDCVGARDETAEAQLRALLKPDAFKEIRGVVVEPHNREDHCRLHVPGFCLQA